MWAISGNEKGELDGIFNSADGSCASVLNRSDIHQAVGIIRDVGLEDIVKVELSRGPDGRMRKTRIEGVLLDLD